MSSSSASNFELNRYGSGAFVLRDEEQACNPDRSTVDSTTTAQKDQSRNRRGKCHLFAKPYGFFREGVKRIIPLVIGLSTSGIVLALGFDQAQNPVSQNPGAPQTSVPLIPSSPGVTQADYQLGPGDSVKISVWTGSEYIDQVLTVASDGSLMLPFFVNKIVPVTGLTALQLRELAGKELKEVFRLPVVQVVIVAFESKRASLVGEVMATGNFPIYANTRILDFFLQHGGFTQKANLTEVQITRVGGQKLKVNVYDIILRADASQNLVLMPGDLVYVPSLETIGQKYFLLGEVRAPGILSSTEPLTLLEAISRSGTLTIAAAAKKVFVVRAKATGPADVKEVRFSDLYTKGDTSQNIALMNGDIIYVPRNFHTRIADIVSTITPLTSVMRDLVLFRDLIARP